VSKTTNTADIYTVGEETIVSEAVARGSVVERGYTNAACLFRLPR
jgi:hypothetical protein